MSVKSKVFINRGENPKELDEFVDNFVFSARNILKALFSTPVPMSAEIIYRESKIFNKWQLLNVHISRKS